MLISVIGLGSNSLRMMLAEIDEKEQTIKQIFRGRDSLRVFAALKTSLGGEISQNMIIHAAEAINSMKLTAIEMGSEKVYLFATSATRDKPRRIYFYNRKTFWFKNGSNIWRNRGFL